MKPGAMALALLLAACAAMGAQTAPAPSGSAPAGPAPSGSSGLPVGGTLRYGLNYGQTAEFGGGLSGEQTSIISGNLSYANISKRHPFSMQYGGGYAAVWAGPPSAGSVFQHLTVAQGVAGRRWNLTAGDNVSYTFETPTVGFTGIPGAGGPIVGSGPPTQSGQTVLANTRTLDNTTTLAFGETLNRSWSLNVGGSEEELHFIDGNGLDTDSTTANAGLTRRLSARSSLSGLYSFSRLSYSGTGITTKSNTAELVWSRKWNRRLTTSAAAGPLWISYSGVPASAGLASPDSTLLFLSASANYQLRRGSAGASYLHGTIGGSGYLLGSKVDSFNGNYTRTIGKNLTVGMTGSYIRSSSLIGEALTGTCQIGSNPSYSCTEQVGYTPVTDAIFGGAQVTRKLGRYFNAYASYTAMSQSTNIEFNETLNGGGPPISFSTNANILNGVEQVIGFGIGYTPREIHLRK
jgi:hypothetical protein